MPLADEPSIDMKGHVPLVDEPSIDMKETHAFGR